MTLFPFLVGWVTLSIIATLATYHGVSLLAERPPVDPSRRVVVIAPVKTSSPLLAEFLARLKSQTYTRARVVVAVESETDCSYVIARAAEQAPGLPLTTLVATRSVDTGQKVWNLLAALNALDEGDEVVVFVDADILPDPQWLHRLVLPILQRRADVVSGYRWLLPRGAGWGAYWAAATNNAIAALPRSRFWNLAWGGSVAIRRDLLDHIQIESWWRGAISDDLQLTRALWSHGIRIVSPPGLIVPTTIECEMAEALEFGRRQYVLVRTHLFAYWAAAAVLVGAPLVMLILASARAARGNGPAITALGIVFVAGQIRVLLRARPPSSIPRDGLAVGARVSRTKLWLAASTQPVFHALCLLTALSSRRIRWSGVDYDILAPQRTRVSPRI